jgi:hypothetical protein
MTRAEKQKFPNIAIVESDAHEVEIRNKGGSGSIMLWTEGEVMEELSILDDGTTVIVYAPKYALSAETTTKFIKKRL